MMTYEVLILSMQGDCDVIVICEHVEHMLVASRMCSVCQFISQGSFLSGLSLNHSMALIFLIFLFNAKVQEFEVYLHFFSDVTTEPHHFLARAVMPQCLSLD